MNRTARPVIGAATLLVAGALVFGGGAPASANSVVAQPGSTPSVTVGFQTIDQPTASYTSRACIADLSTVRDGTTVDLLVSQCGFLVHVTPSTVKRSVPRTWTKWAKAPFVERTHPDVLWTAASGTLTLSWDVQNTIGGVEVESRQAGTDVFTATYFSGPDGAGTIVGTVVRQASSPNGARLLAADSNAPWQSIVITSQSGRDFAVAQIRAS